MDNNTKKKRCEKGYRRDVKTGECIQNKTKKTSTSNFSESSPRKESDNRKTKCKKGQRWDNKTKKCLEMTKEFKEYKFILRKNQRLAKEGKPKMPLPPYPIKEYELPSSIIEEPVIEIPSIRELIEDSIEKSSKENQEQKHVVIDVENAKVEKNKEQDNTNEEINDIKKEDLKSKDQFQQEGSLNLYDPDATPLAREFAEYEASKISVEDPLLYPTIDDAQFAAKIANRKEFAENQYDGVIRPIEEYANQLCSAKFEILPHQMFVKNFLSYQTPYNSLLLYHGLGSGKTCSAIGIAEETRAYMKQMGITKRIFVIASPNVQSNFRAQLFDPEKLVEINGEYQIQNCIGNTLLHEVDPTQLRGLPREVVIRNIFNIIKSNYEFMGYGEFANYIEKRIVISEESGFTEAEKKQRRIQNIRFHFNDRLVIIDEVHNIRISDDNNKDKKRIAVYMNEIAKYSTNMRMLLLSATPMYNSYKEIIWLTNLLNINDGRATISIDDVFDKEGNFKEKSKETEENGRSLLQRKLNGYVSYVRGENPYVFPYRIYPDTFAPDNIMTPEIYPKRQMNQMEITDTLKYIPVYMTKIGGYQIQGYRAVLQYMMERSYSSTTAMGAIKQMPSFENMESFGYAILFGPIESLNMIYPTSALDNAIETGKTLNQEECSQIYGKNGLQSIIKYETLTLPNPLKYHFEYKEEILKKYGRIFARERIGNHSGKISQICDCIRNAKGIVLIYSQFIDGGCIPMALALEEMGFSRFGTASYTQNLFKKRPIEAIDSRTMKPRSEVLPDEFRPAKYVLITGDANYSPNNAADIKYVSNKDNADGSRVKVIIISKAASEGLDFKCIRQIHIMDPWYHMNRIEQTIGRGVRNLSHCALPFRERNVEIYMHATLLDEVEEEAADLYMFRIAEKKTSQIGKITRLLKEVAVDCQLNYSQTNFTVEGLARIAENQNIEIHLSSGKNVIYKIGDKPFTEICDYMDNCEFQCIGSNFSKEDLILDTYNTKFMQNNIQNIEQRIRELFREQTVYKRDQLVAAINIRKKYPIEHIYYVITQLDDIVDPYGRVGCLINKGEYYAFQPKEIADENISVFERTRPIDYKRSHLLMEVSKIENIRPKRGISQSIKTTKENQSYEMIMNVIRSNIQNMYKENIVVTGGDDDWFKNANYITNLLLENHNIGPDKLNKYAIHHILDTMDMSDKIILLEELFDYREHERDEYERQIYNYMNRFIVEYQGQNAIIIADGAKNVIYISSQKEEEFKEEEKKNHWKEAEPEDYVQINLQEFIISKKSIANTFGFIHPFKKGEMVFKIKQQGTKRNNKGIKCINMGLNLLIEKINEVLKKNVYNTKSPFKKRICLCILLEILMRHHLDSNNENIVFFPPEISNINSVEVI